MAGRSGPGNRNMTTASDLTIGSGAMVEHGFGPRMKFMVRLPDTARQIASLLK